MSVQTKRIILCGMGNVGRAFLKLLNERSGELAEKYKLRPLVCCVADLGGAAVAADGLPLGELLRHAENGGGPETLPGFGVPGLGGTAAIGTGAYDLLVNAAPTNLKDAEPGLSFVRAAIARGMDVVSADKGPFVLRFAELRRLAEESGGRLFISAATGAALPTLDVGRFSTLGAHITSVEGVLNGTTNYILTMMGREKTTYAEALEKARAMGIAERDPTLDVEGYDSRNKLILIANTLLGADVGPDDVPTRGITGVTREDIAEAECSGMALKLVAEAAVTDGGVRLSVAPKLLERSHPLASVNYNEKGVTYTTDTMGQITVSGGKSSPGGAAAALLKDILHSHIFR